MIKDYFGITTGNFIKAIIFITFILFFIRLVHLLINFAKGKSKKELRMMFIATETILWSAMLAWFYFEIPLKKMEFIGIMLVFTALNFYFWLQIRDYVAGFFVKKIIPLTEAKQLKLNAEIYDIKSIDNKAITLANKAIEQEFNFSKFIKNEITFPFEKTLKIKTNEYLKNSNELKATLSENNFINKNTDVSISLKDDTFIIQIIAFFEDDLDKIELFLDEIL